MTATDTEHAYRYPVAEWLRSIEFPDPAGLGTDDEPPVHVCAAPILFNGARAEGRILHAPITVQAGYDADGDTVGTVVSFVVGGEDIDWGDGDQSEGRPGKGARVCGLHVLAPDGDAWTVEDDGEPDHDILPAYRVHLFARTVSFTGPSA